MIAVYGMRDMEAKRSRKRETADVKWQTKRIIFELQCLPFPFSLFTINFLYRNFKVCVKNIIKNLTRSIGVNGYPSSTGIHGEFFGGYKTPFKLCLLRFSSLGNYFRKTIYKNPQISEITQTL